MKVLPSMVTQLPSAAAIGSTYLVHFLPIPVSSLHAITVPSESMTPMVRSVVSLNCSTTF